MYTKKLNLNPAEWIWINSQRTLPNTKIIFRKTFNITKITKNIKLLAHAESKFRIFLNEENIFCGPIPSDPRFTEIQELLISNHLRMGKNVLIFDVFFAGNYTHDVIPTKPGLIFKIFNDETVFAKSSPTTKSAIDWLITPGLPKRAHLYSLQESQNLQKSDHDWMLSNYQPQNLQFNPSILTNCPANKPTIYGSYKEYSYSESANPKTNGCLWKSGLPVLELSWQKSKLVQKHSFAFVSKKDREEIQAKGLNDAQNLFRPGNDCVSYVFDFKQIAIGALQILIDIDVASEVEIRWHEIHYPNYQKHINIFKNSWAIIKTHSGNNKITLIEEDSSRFVEVVVWTSHSRIKKLEVKKRVRVYPSCEKECKFNFENPNFQRLAQSQVNAIRTLNKGYLHACSAREPQQYTGHGGGASRMVYSLWNDRRVAKRYFKTICDSYNSNRLFMDSWPAGDKIEKAGFGLYDLTFWNNQINHSFWLVEDVYEYLITDDISSFLIKMGVLDKCYDFLLHMLELTTANDGVLPARFSHGMVGLDLAPQTSYDWKWNYEKAHLAINCMLINSLRYGEAIARFNNNSELAMQFREDRKKLALKVEQKWMHNNLLVTHLKPVIMYDEISLSCAILNKDVFKSIDISRTINLLASRKNVYRVIPLHVYRTVIRALFQERQYCEIKNRIVKEWSEMHLVNYSEQLPEFWNDWNDRDNTDFISNNATAVLHDNAFELLRSLMGISIVDCSFKEEVILKPIYDLIGNFEHSFYLKNHLFNLKLINGIFEVKTDCKIKVMDYKNNLVLGELPGTYSFNDN